MTTPLGHAERGYLRSRWGQLHFRRAGQLGPPLLLLHQVASSSRMWDRVLPSLGERFQVVAIDLPGFGMSDPPPAPPSSGDYVEVLFEALDALGFDRAIVGGFHTGAGFAADMAVARPDRIPAIVLLGVPLVDNITLTSRPRGAGGAWEPDLDGQFLLDMWRFYTNPYLWVRLREFTDKLNAGPNGYWITSALFDHDLRAILRQVRCPTLICFSETDFARPASEETKRDLIPDAELVMLTGQMLLADSNPEALSRTIVQFIESISGHLPSEERDGTNS